ncbi:sigma 54-interacting transcriptional regulator [Aciduricibacillus chroicocephali]|uniref:Sigma 54-interacting transcriptional regulator n=1 Tax=Aciduricibacillus chroicocephali TaxID=3054939 RepID=A0ABY9KRR9_9BACI|nr:sigma 54-interacting transcriptional regulator [Bacillaceae bacterium 44XB]
MDKRQTPPYQWLLEQFPVFFLTADEQGRIQAANKEAVEIAISKNDIFGMKAEDVFPGIHLEEVLRSRRGDWNGRFRMGDGEDMIMAKLPLFDGEEKLTGVAAIGAKVREVIRLAEKHADLNDLTVLMEGILNVFAEPFSIADHQGRTWYANDSCLQLLGQRSDLPELENAVHKQVQQTRRAVNRCFAAETGHHGDLHVRAVPLMLDGKLKGSIAVYEEDKDRVLEQELSASKQLVRKLEGMRLFVDFSAQSDTMQLAVDHGKLAARTLQPVLLRGEEGTGKRHFAEAIHNESELRFQPFIIQDCREKIPDHLFRTVSKGTIVLEHIESLNKSAQQKVLEFLEQEEKRGSRIICITSANLEQAISDHDFSRELYAILSRMTIYLPPLRSRKADMEILVNRFIYDSNNELGRYVQSATKETVEMLKKRTFLKNIAELKVFIQTAMLRTDPEEVYLKPSHFESSNTSERVKEEEELENHRPLQDALEDFEKRYIQDIYRKSGYNKTKTADMLKISIRNLYYKMEKYHIDKTSMQNNAE